MIADKKDIEWEENFTEQDLKEMFEDEKLMGFALKQGDD